MSLDARTVGAGATTAVGLWFILRWLFTGDKPPVADTPGNREWLARVLMTEQSFPGRGVNYGEWGGIAWVAINRAARRSTTIKKAVLTSDWFGTSPPARMVSKSLLTRGNGPKAVAFADAVFDGRTRNRIGSRWHFVHVAGFKRCDRVGADLSNKFVCTSTRAGLRRLPRWSVAKGEVGGRAGYRPIEIGAARFS